MSLSGFRQQIPGRVGGDRSPPGWMGLRRPGQQLRMVFGDGDRPGSRLPVPEGMASGTFDCARGMGRGGIRAHRIDGMGGRASQASDEKCRRLPQYGWNGRPVLRSVRGSLHEGIDLCRDPGGRSPEPGPPSMRIGRSGREDKPGRRSARWAAGPIIPPYCSIWAFPGGHRLQLGGGLVSQRL